MIPFSFWIFLHPQQQQQLLLLLLNRSILWMSYHPCFLPLSTKPLFLTNLLCWIFQCLPRLLLCPPQFPHLHLTILHIPLPASFQHRQFPPSRWPTLFSQLLRIHRLKNPTLFSRLFSPIVLIRTIHMCLNPLSQMC